MNLPLHIPTGPHGLNTIDFRPNLANANLANANLANTTTYCEEAAARPNSYWIALVDGPRQFADAYCTATTAVERNEAIQWMRDMAAVLQGGAE
jgi:hypothetical protein